MKTLREEVEGLIEEFKDEVHLWDVNDMPKESLDVAKKECLDSICTLIERREFEARIDELETNMGYFDAEDWEILRDRINELQSKLTQEGGRDGKET